MTVATQLYGAFMRLLDEEGFWLGDCRAFEKPPARARSLPLLSVEVPISVLAFIGPHDQA